MPTGPGRPDDGRSATFGYYMIRLSYPRHEAERAERRLSGLVERLATGEKRSFESAAELMHLLDGWSAPTGRAPGGARL